MGAHVRTGVFIFYLIALLLWGGAFWMIRPQIIALITLAPVALHLFWQVLTLRIADGDDALAKFRSNRFAGFVMALACLAVGTAG